MWFSNFIIILSIFLSIPKSYPIIITNILLSPIFKIITFIITNTINTTRYPSSVFTLSNHKRWHCKITSNGSSSEIRGGAVAKGWDASPTGLSDFSYGEKSHSQSLSLSPSHVLYIKLLVAQLTLTYKLLILLTNWLKNGQLHYYSHAPLPHVSYPY